METINGERVKISLVIGYAHTDWNVSEFLTKLEEEITTLFGGCRVESKRGLWREDGNSTQPFNGELFEEDSVEFTILTDLDVEKALTQLRVSCENCKFCTRGDVPVEWVNVETTQVECHHFKM
jgi:hypothetical protein